MKKKCFCALGIFALCVTVYAGDTGIQQIELVGVSEITNLAPLPPGISKANIEAQPTNVPVPVFRMISDEEVARGGTANTGAATAIVFRNSHDTGFGNFNKSEAGNFVANLLHLGNGFMGGEVKGYDLLIYNSVSSPGGDAAARVSLWDGDPLGFIDTRNNDPPQEIPGSACTFTGMVQAGLGTFCDIGVTDLCVGGYLDGTPCAADSDCGLCPALPGDDIPECPGLFRLECNMDPKVTLPTRNVWMVVEWLEGCRMGWRWALFDAPEIAASGEENFCAGTCPAAPGPCVDLAIELVDGASQWSGIGVGTCCEDNGIVCDHSDGVPECGHATSCSDDVATDFSGWCFGAPTYFASFVASIYANTDTYFRIQPVGGTGTCDTIVGDTIHCAKGGEAINFEVLAAGWDSDGDGNPAVKVWQAQIDSGTFTSGLAGSLTNDRPACDGSIPDHAACPDNALGEQCQAGNYCGGAWQNCPARGPFCIDLPACDVSGPNPRCGSTVVFSPPVVDDGTEMYGMAFRLASSFDAKGIFSVGFRPDPDTFMKDQLSAGIPLVGYLPGHVKIVTGQCCDLSVPYPFICLGDEYTENECTAVGGLFNSTKTCADPCGCEIDAHCDDGDACTDDSCNPDGTCANVDNFDTATLCCDPATGGTTEIDDGNECTTDYCSLGGTRGIATHDPEPAGTPCDDGVDCDTVNDICDGMGGCAGTPISDFGCTNDLECEAVDPAASCNEFLGVCICQLPEITCDVSGFKGDSECVDEGSKIEVDILFRFTPQVVNGAQFALQYDPTCLDFVSIGPGGDPYVFEIEEIVDEGAGYVFYAVGVNPFGGVGQSGSGVLATASFIKIGECNGCGIDFTGDNPQDTIMVDDTGQPVVVIPVPCGPVYDNSDAHLVVPPGGKYNVDCDNVTADVSWDPPNAWSDCYDVDLVCSGAHESGYVYPNGVVMNGGELAIGLSTFCCTATDTFCGHEVSDCWTVEVNDETSFDVTVQLSPILAGDLHRCIEFELYADCVQAPLHFEEELWFGGLWDHLGHFTDLIKIPSAGQWVCITAMDQLHSLRASASLTCVGGVYQAIFKGDPFFGGNWLIQGNLDGWKKDNPLASHDVIDILDFGQFVAMYLMIVDPNTTCEDFHAGVGHGDINGDGIVDGLDFAFIMQNFLAVSKNACCPDAATSVAGRTSVTVRELRQMGLSDLAVADLNSDGVVDSADMTAFMNGAQPDQKRPIRGSGSSLRGR